jgi:hypothetical protein
VAAAKALAYVISSTPADRRRPQEIPCEHHFAWHAVKTRHSYKIFIDFLWQLPKKKCMINCLLKLNPDVEIVK